MKTQRVITDAVAWPERPLLGSAPVRLSLAPGTGPAGLAPGTTGLVGQAPAPGPAPARVPHPRGSAAGPTSGAAGPEATARDAPPGDLPEASRVLAVIARPGQESADLGAVLISYRLRGADLTLLCLTHGEASEMNSTCERLELVRPWELQVAAGLLGVSSVTVADYPDGRLGNVPPATLTEQVKRAIRRSGADLLLVADPAAVADADTVAVARAVRLAAAGSGLPVLARTLPGPGLRWRVSLGADGTGVRAMQRHALEAHASQRTSRPGYPPVVEDHRDWELVRWLAPPAPVTSQARVPAVVST